MSGRDLVISIKADASGLANGLRTAKAGVTDFGKSLEKSAAKRKALTDIGNGFGAIGLAAAAGAGIAIKSFADFDEAMAHVKATGSDAAGSIDKLRAAAIQAGAATKFSATEAANGVEELEKAGVSAADVLKGGLTGALNLAAAGGLGVADAATITATALQQFQLPGTQATHVADLLAAAAGKAQGEVSDFAYALKYAGVPAKALGVSIEETTGTLALFAAKGILGEQAGTNLRSIMLSLAAPTKIAGAVMKQYGLDLYGANGKFVGLTAAADQLHTKLGDLSDEKRNKALSDIFGQNAIQGAIALYEGGGKAVKDWTKQVNDSGYAAKVAATQMDNLKGDFEQLTGSLQTALIGAGGGANGPLRGLTQDLTGLINKFNELPPGVQGATVKFLGLTAAIGLGVFAASRAVTGYFALKTAMTGLGLATSGLAAKQLLLRGGSAIAGSALIGLSGEADKLHTGLGGVTTALGAAAIGFSVGGPWGAAIGGAVGIVAAFAKANHVAVPDVQSLTASLDTQNGSITANTKAMVLNELKKNGAYKKGAAAGVGAGQVTDAALGNKAALAKIVAARNSALAYANSLASQADASGGNPNSKALAETRAQIDAYNALLTVIDAQTGSLADAKAAWQQEADAKAHSLELNKLGAADVDMLTKKVKGLPKEAATKFTTPGYKDAVQNAAEVAHEYKLNPKEVTTILKALNYTKPQINAVLKAMGILDGTTAKPKVRVDPGNSFSILKGFQKTVNGLTGKTVYVKVKQQGGTPGGQLINAQGGIWDYYANGGFAESHIAQIAPAGANRVWAEPETGGEAYIPLAASKRARSRQIATETVSRLGGVAQFADGGFNGASSSGSDSRMFRLVDPRVSFDNSGLRLIDDRIELVTAGHSRVKTASDRRTGSNR